jgi:hypothetical protein
MSDDPHPLQSDGNKRCIACLRLCDFSHAGSSRAHQIGGVEFSATKLSYAFNINNADGMNLRLFVALLAWASTSSISSAMPSEK